MAKKITQNSRQWTENETKLFAKVLCDDENNFALSLEQLALKKSSNNEVFEHIKRTFDEALLDADFIVENDENFLDKDGKIKLVKKLDTSLEKLRNKYKFLKKKWSEINQKVRHGSGLSPIQEPIWYPELNLVFSETNAEVNLVSASTDLSYNDGNQEESDDDDNNDEEDDDDDDNDDNDENSQIPSKKLVVAPHKKRKAIRSNRQALSSLANGLKQMAESQAKRHKETLEAEKRQFEMLLQFKREEAEANRAHELRMAEIFARRSSPEPNRLANSQLYQPPAEPFRFYPSVQSTPNKESSFSSDENVSSFSALTGFNYKH